MAVNERVLVWAIKAIDQASPALGQVAKSMSKLHHSAFQARDALGRFVKESEVKGGAGAAGFAAMAAALKSTWAILLAIGKVIETIFSKVFGIFKRVADAVWNVAKRLWHAYLQLWKFAVLLASVSFGALVAGLTIATKWARDFEMSLAKVRGVTGATQAETAELAKALREMARVSTFTPAELAEGAYYLASAGWNIQQIREGLPGIIKFSEAFGADFATAAETVVAVLSQFRMRASEATRVANVFAAANAASMAELEKLRYSLQYVGPVAGALGVRFEETVAALALLYNAGLRGMQAGTELRMILLRLIHPTQEAQEILAKYGLTLRDVNPMIHGIAGALEPLIRAHITTADAAELFGAETVGAYLALQSAGIPALKAMEERITGTQQAFLQGAVQADTLGYAFKFLISSVQELGLVFGAPLLGPLKRMVQALSDFVNWLGQTREVRLLATILRRAAEFMEQGFVRALRGLQQSWDRIWPAIYGTLQRFGAAIVGVVGGLVAVGRYLIEHWREVGQFLAAIWRWLVQVHIAAIGLIVRAIVTIELALRRLAQGNIWQAIAGLVVETAKFIMQALLQLVAAFYRAVSGVYGRLLLFTNKWIYELAARLVEWLARAVGNIQIDYSKFGEGLKGFVDRMGAMLRETDLGALFAEAWQSPEAQRAQANAMQMADNIMHGLSRQMPQFSSTLASNLIGAFQRGSSEAIQGFMALIVSAEEEIRRLAETSGTAAAQAVTAATAVPGAELPEELIQISPQLKEQLEELAQAARTLFGPLERLRADQENLQQRISSLQEAIEQSREALQRNTEMLRRQLQLQYSQLPLGMRGPWAMQAIMQEIISELPLQELAALVPNWQRMTEGQVFGTLMRHPAVYGMALEKMMSLSFGELGRYAWQAYEPYMEQVVAAYQQQGEQRIAQLERELNYLQSQSQLLDQMSRRLDYMQRVEVWLAELAKAKAQAEMEGSIAVVQLLEAIIARVRGLLTAPGMPGLPGAAGGGNVVNIGGIYVYPSTNEPARLGQAIASEIQKWLMWEQRQARGAMAVAPP